MCHAWGLVFDILRLEELLGYDSHEIYKKHKVWCVAVGVPVKKIICNTTLTHPLGSHNVKGGGGGA